MQPWMVNAPQTSVEGPPYVKAILQPPEYTSLVREQARSWKLLHGSDLQNIIAEFLTYPGKSGRTALWK